MDKNFIVKEINRLDKFLSEELKTSRNQIEQLIRDENIKINGKVVSKTGYKLKENDEVEVNIPEPTITKEYEVDFDVEIIYEDEDILVINKPTNLTVHGAPSVKEATLVDWLKSKNISLSTISGEERHGIVHRLDKGTSGVMVVAKTNEAHSALSAQLEDKSMGRYYIAVINEPLKENVIVDKPIARNPNNRLKMGIIQNGRNAKSAFAKLQLDKNEKIELITAKLFTGRTHQIRVHLDSIGRHIMGDDLYGFKSNLNKISRIYLHAFCLYLKHPTTNKYMDFIAPIPYEFENFLSKHFIMEQINEKLSKDYIIDSFDNCDNWLYRTI